MGSKSKTKTLSKNSKNLPQSPTAIKPKSRGNFRPKDQQLRIMNDISGLLPKHNDLEIMKILGLPHSTFYRYKDRLYQESKELWQRTRTEDLELRAINIMSYLQLCTRINEEIALNKELDPKARIEAASQMVNSQLKIYLLLRDGPELDSR